jgi:DNA-binding NarL/FixJ family response regulator
VSIRVLVVDDERLVRTGLRMIIESESGLTVAGEASDGAMAIDAVRRVRPDVALMDIRMPVLDGLAATRRILADPACRTRVIVLTTFDLDEYVYEALAVGASGFLLKDAPEDQLVAAIRTAAGGGSLYGPTVTRRLIERFARRREPASRESGLETLTPREREVLGLVARGRSNAEIAVALGISDHTAKTHVAHLLDKLDLRDRVQAVVLAYECGLVTPGEDGPEQQE